jgi:hypothetical protein
MGGMRVFVNGVGKGVAFEDGTIDGARNHFAVVDLAGTAVSVELFLDRDLPAEPVLESAGADFGLGHGGVAYLDVHGAQGLPDACDVCVRARGSQSRVVWEGPLLKAKVAVPIEPADVMIDLEVKETGVSGLFFLSFVFSEENGSTSAAGCGAGLPLGSGGGRRGRGCR